MQLTGKCFVPDLIEIVLQILDINPFFQVSEVQILAVDSQQRSGIRAIDNATGQQLVEDKIFTG